MTTLSVARIPGACAHPVTVEGETDISKNNDKGHYDMVIFTDFQIPHPR